MCAWCVCAYPHTYFYKLREYDLKMRKSPVHYLFGTTYRIRLHTCFFYNGRFFFQISIDLCLSYNIYSPHPILNLREYISVKRQFNIQNFTRKSEVQDDIRR